MNMKKAISRVILILLICIIALVFYICWMKERNLTDVYPMVATGEYQQAQLVLGNDVIEVEVSDEEFRNIFQSGRIKRGRRTRLTPECAFEVRMTDGRTGYSIVLGYDQSLAIARIDDLEGSRSFWTDIDGAMFFRLYRYYLEHGGEDSLMMYHVE